MSRCACERVCVRTDGEGIGRVPVDRLYTFETCRDVGEDVNERHHFIDYKACFGGNR